MRCTEKHWRWIKKWCWELHPREWCPEKHPGKWCAEKHRRKLGCFAGGLLRSGDWLRDGCGRVEDRGLKFKVFLPLIKRWNNVSHQPSTDKSIVKEMRSRLKYYAITVFSCFASYSFFTSFWHAPGLNLGLGLTKQNAKKRTLGTGQFLFSLSHADDEFPFWAYSEDGGPLTNIVVFTAFSGS